MRGHVSPKLKPFLAQVNEQIAQAKADNVQFTPEMVRTNLDKLAALVSHVPDINYCEDKTITDDNQQVSVRVYSPNPQQALPVLVYFHGGGHMCGSVALYDPMCRKMANAAQCVVVSVEYRLAPEFPYPMGLDDCELAFKHVEQALGDVAYTPQFFIGGDSAGGAICTSLVMRSLTGDSLNIAGQLLIYPSVDYTMSSNSVVENGEGFLLESGKVSWYFDHYFANNENRAAVSAINGPINSDIPPSLVITAGCDPLRDEGLAYVGALTSAGVQVTHVSFDDMIHAFMNIEDLVEEECQQLYQHMADFIQTNH